MVRNTKVGWENGWGGVKVLNTHTWDVAVCICNPSTPRTRCEAEPGEPSGSLQEQPALESAAQQQQQERPCSVRSKSWYLQAVLWLPHELFCAILESSLYWLEAPFVIASQGHSYLSTVSVQNVKNVEPVDCPLSIFFSAANLYLG